ncbi:LapA family protein [Mycolicibacillus parakoreensis]|uniref:LapA family protein n=1 Tax=Mycolicibacillus parakoreensis TaxID=1069221 RepID=A0ABY3TWI9_9MYCO|nr:protein UsfY [Mycolicibacillus parakoreensis]MCV7315524.1 LapA family protein [Mycolicibacillus parakoreensis]ULN52025.1 LapA family protein [Mycolicibacillus parakoreensis]HLS00297.1 protein UsfY [Mycolicibacillus parakoreensis]
MGSTFHDPIDHARTTREFAGESLIDVLNWPGYALVAIGLVGFAGSLTAFGTGHTGQGLTVGIVGFAVLAVGLIWVIAEHWRVRRIAERWYAGHPDAQRRPPSG